jgi:hypothetical protein
MIVVIFLNKIVAYLLLKTIGTTEGDAILLVLL